MVFRYLNHKNLQRREERRQRLEEKKGELLEILKKSQKVSD